jgi:hypothetical protein
VPQEFEGESSRRRAILKALAQTPVMLTVAAGVAHAGGSQDNIRSDLPQCTPLVNAPGMPAPPGVDCSED